MPRKQRATPCLAIRSTSAASRSVSWRDEKATRLNPSLRGAKRRSNPYYVMRRHGLLRRARNGHQLLSALNNNHKGLSRMPHPLDTFFCPDSIALIGASRDQEKIPG